MLPLEHVPRLQNDEADAITNDETSAFDPASRVEVELSQLPSKVMNELLEIGETFTEGDWCAAKAGIEAAHWAMGLPNMAVQTAS